ncbi:glycosyltransferase family 4 protein [Mucilaginibacter sp. JRF]|uniref:glycosyltransferase family 4 protein n=1 Tax=Mucilaginibacter sp. JRF TaxID=2780088 RepID=UPI001880807E|nr:glycosyltransferase family 4 protein [Mucilaginibacter sp. JRF]MBE9584235.1 glycosyltransferase family 4 protein [Mucilaginibacter sp. JRF]
MKIGIIAHLKHPIKAPFAGGLEAFTYEISHRLTERGHEIILFASSSSEAGGTLYPILNDISYDPMSGERIKKPDLSSEYIAEHHAYYQLMTEIDRMNLDVIFNNSLHYVPVMMAGVIRSPMVMVLHTPPFYELKLAVRAEQDFKNIAYVTVSRSNANSWRDFVPDCPFIHNGIDLNKWSFYPAGLQKNYAVWFGRIHPDKGLDLAIRAAKLAGIPLKVAGAIGDKKYYKEIIEPLLDENTEMLGLLNHQQLNKLIGEAQVCLITPVWQEPFGLVAAEAMACGTPIAGVKAGALPEIITNETGLLVNTHDANDLAKAIRQAITMNRQKIREHAEAKLNIDDMLTHYENFLESLIADRLSVNTNA